MNNKLFIFKILLILYLIFVLSGCKEIKNPFKIKTPESTEVKKTINEIIEKKKKEIQKQNFLNDLIYNLVSDIGKWLSNIKTIIKFISILLGVMIVQIIIYLIIRYNTTKKYRYKNTEKIKKDFINIEFNEKHLKKLINENDYNKAILFLHHYSIFYLISNKITYKKNMTNYDYLKKINDIKQQEVFKKIYTVSEKILFDDYIADKNDFEECYCNFEKSFAFS